MLIWKDFVINMWSISYLTLIIYQFFILSILPLYFSEITITKKMVLKIALLIVVPPVVLFAFIGVYAMAYVVLVVSFFVYQQTKRRRNIVHVLFTIVLVVMADHISSLVVYHLSNGMEAIITSPLVQLFVSMSILFILVLVYKRLLRYFAGWYVFEQYIILAMIPLLIMTIAFMYTDIVLIDSPSFISSVQHNLFFFVIYLMIFIIIICFFVYLAIKNIHIKQKEKELEEFKSYVASLEEINRDMRKFKHDYKNILTSMRHFIDSKNYSELETYFYRHILQTEKNEQVHEMAFSMLNCLHIPSLKGLLTTKLIQAQTFQIPMYVEIVEDIDRIALDEIQLNRLCGILLDNALEASKNATEPWIRLAIIRMDGAVLIVCVNTFSSNQSNELKVHKIFKEGFSTKGEERGLGLSILRQMVDASLKLRLNTKINGNLFIQELFIDDQEVQI
ncbi:GHKL domain-containing protein [Lysinibacillus irui]|uniref:GHKL domain-containing protein n=1 Tax=Lysinibacillus irui TaxID=2998077 RepID=A0ABU5NJH7_9BACI|nr:GHKL domain-containing protein [Lysinibacillus irui]MEA0553737.1 GHKL domain-containing protein [Lysinibacillus irui]MEA0976121.1 GHKL domain-containing protein [Lysinibacillus irui]MEA1042275.1 GHKL domain-containing protein [Lysinibacillus irui]